MIKRFDVLIFILLIPLIVVTDVSSQGKPYEGPEDGAGDKAVERIGVMEGNSVRCQFRNTTELSDWGAGTDPYASKWPNDFRGSKMNDGIALLIGARVYLKKTDAKVDSIPVDNPELITNLGAQNLLHTVYFLQTSYREEQDTDPTGQIEWNLYPPRGYMNLTLPNIPPAISDRPNSWPPEGWPSRGSEKKWPGEWNGRFGRGVYKADLECFFVANDAQDQEYLQDTARVKYYPRPGRVIGDFDPNVSIQCGLPWGGAGIRVEQRGFQWNNPQARDAIFWEYNIANISNYNLSEVAFGYWVDCSIGDDEGNDEFAAYDTKLDLAYCWDSNGIGSGGLKVGTSGFAYLESPANSQDGIDNDEDGLVDEKRDNIVQPGESKIGPLDGISDLAKFLDFYHREESDLKEHYAADEDQDWDDGVDTNGNGVYDVEENPGDDVGLDGVGPGELNYTGPDADGSECNHKPDLLEGYGCEPDFGLLDISESDMLGLTSFRLIPIPEHTPPYTNWFRNDKSMWELIGKALLVPYVDTKMNLGEVFATGVFPLDRGCTERISMSELHSWDDGSYIKPTWPVTNPPLSLFRLKEIVQVIYESDYRFASPPIMPTLKATAGDGYVLLTWDNVSEIFTRDAFANNQNDFEGYKLYQATDRDFTDAKQFSNGYGNPTDFKKPIFQCDKIDRIKGFAEFGHVDGMLYNLGNDTGIRHMFRDENVENGRTYYYALVAYDYGMEDIGLTPSENNVVINIDKAEQITFTSRNVAIATPHPAAAGYKSQKNISVIRPENMIGTGTVLPEVISADALKENAIYKIAFDVDTVRTMHDLAWGVIYSNSGFKIWDITSGKKLVYQENRDHRGTALLDSTITTGHYYIRTGDVVTDLFDGLFLHIQMPVHKAAFDEKNSGWVTGTGKMRITFTRDETSYFPWDYDVVFTDNPNSYQSDFNIGKSWQVRDEYNVRITENLLSHESFNFYVLNTSVANVFTDQQAVMELIVQDVNKNGVYDQIGDRIFVGGLTTSRPYHWGGTAFIIDFAEAMTKDELPKSGDLYKIKFNRPFWTTDTLTFSANIKEFLVEKDIASDLKKVKVVPNPYVATNALEPALANTDFNQRRRIMFTHVPAQCTIKIFSVSGVFIDEIDVNNASDDGIAYWDLLTKDRMELAAGMYIYYIKAVKTGDEVMGKFAILK